VRNVILFDLDGTLADTAPDLGLALNMQRERHGLPPLPQEAIRPYASHGSRGLLSIGFGLVPENAAFASMRDEYLALYDEVFTSSPRLFEGMDGLLGALESRGLAWGVVTNKPRRFSAPLMQALGLQDRAACLVCGDDVAQAKPAPDSLLRACGLTASHPADCMYVGDAERDIAAGRAAGMRTVLAMYGYIDAADTPEAWAADAVIHAPLELLELI
jgi:N-acetyl-D-muramate 6-phosphate phosphatase